MLAQHALRAQLKELMASSSSTGPSLSVSTARLRAGRDGNVADISDAPVDSSFSDFDSSVASIGKVFVLLAQQKESHHLLAEYVVYFVPVSKIGRYVQ